MKGLKSTAALAVVASALVTSAARAQEASGIEEIIVTAQKRETSLLDTPLAITAVSGDALENQKLDTVEDLASALPSVNFMRGPTTSSIAVRGVGSVDVNVGTESRTAFHIDGVYISRPELAISQLFDVERVEYLRGPQGTLYGRNATGGAINIISRQPGPDFEGFAQATVGNYGTVNLLGAINVPLGSTVSARFSGNYSRRDGYIRDETSGKDVNDLNVVTLRGKVRWEPSDNFTLGLTGSYYNEDDREGAQTFIGQGNPAVIPLGLRFGGATGSFPDVATDERGFPYNRKKAHGLSADAKWEVLGGDISALLSYQDFAYEFRFDTDATSAPVTAVIAINDSEQRSAELRYHRGNEIYDLTVGGYYFKEKLRAFLLLPFNLQILGGPDLFAEGVTSGGDLSTEAYAAFAQLRVNFTPQIYAEVGGRFSYERKHVRDGVQVVTDAAYTAAREPTVAVTATGTESWRSFDPKVTIGYQPTRNLNIYATYSEAFKSGGFNLGSFATTFRPEAIKGFEVGMKFRNAARTVSLELTGFDYDYTDMQVNQVAADGVTVQLINAASSSIRGIELEARWIPIAELNLGLTADILDAAYDDFQTANPARPDLGLLQLRGNRLPQASRYKVRADATYTWNIGEGKLAMRGDITFKDRVYFTPYNYAPASSGRPATEINASLTYDLDDWTFQVFGRNLTDQRRFVYAQVSGALPGFTTYGRVNDPRTYGISVTRRW